jgi:hypothetical protein
VQDSLNWSLTVVTVLTVLRGDLACEALIRMILLPPLPSRLNAISMPSARSDVWARRSRPASARGDFGQATIARTIDADPQQL